MNSHDILNKLLLDNPRIVKYRVFPFVFDNKVQTRIDELDQNELNVIDATRKYKQKYSISFWESYLRICEDSKNIKKRLVDGVLFHKPNTEYLYFENDGGDILKKISLNDSIALNSQIIIRGGLKRHIPLLDFKIPSKDGSLPIVEELLHEMNLKGYLMDSGKSYHFIGDSIITSTELTELLAKFVLLHPVSDKSWAAHQIIEGSSSLRITEKKGQLPILVKMIK